MYEQRMMLSASVRPPGRFIFRGKAGWAANQDAQSGDNCARRTSNTPVAINTFGENLMHKHSFERLLHEILVALNTGHTLKIRTIKKKLSGGRYGLYIFLVHMRKSFFFFRQTVNS